MNVEEEIHSLNRRLDMVWDTAQSADNTAGRALGMIEPIPVAALAAIDAVLRALLLTHPDKAKLLQALGEAASNFELPGERFGLGAGDQFDALVILDKYRALVS